MSSRPEFWPVDSCWGAGRTWACITVFRSSGVTMMGPVVGALSGGIRGGSCGGESGSSSISIGIMGGVVVSKGGRGLWRGALFAAAVGGQLEGGSESTHMSVRPFASGGGSGAGCVVGHIVVCVAGEVLLWAGG